MGGTQIERAGDYQGLAQAHLDPLVWRYLQDGDPGGNEERLKQIALMPRPLVDCRAGHTRLSLFGQTLSHPLLLAPMAYQKLFHEHGEIATAMAASAQDAVMVISSLASEPIEDIVRVIEEEGGPAPWFQLYWQQDRARTLKLLKRAEQAGCHAIVFTVDAPIKLATMQLPAHVRAVNLEPPLPLPLSPDAGTRGASLVFQGWMAQAPTWDDLRWLREQTNLPLLLKGVLHPGDAELAISSGMDGLIVSNHGGRVQGGAVLSLDALSAVSAQVAGRVPVLFDSGVRDGRDAYVALAKGATAVLLGRPLMWGLAASGAMGVAHVVRLLRDELEMTMALTGCVNLDEVRSGRGLA